MDLFCPHCTRRVTVPDDKAGTVLSCPLCAKQFMAPSLAPAAPPVPKPPPAPSPPTPAPTAAYELGPAPVLPVTQPPVTPKPVADTPPLPSPPVPPPPGDYTRSFALELRGHWLPFVPTACLALIFFLSFFSWHHRNLSLWGLSFSSESEGGKAQFLAYTIMMMLCVFLAAASMLFEKNVFITPPPLVPLIRWKDLIVGFALSLGLLLLTLDYFSSNFGASPNPMLVPMKVAYRLHFIATAASFLLFWLHLRRQKNAPPLKLEIKW